ncbi:MAG: hypothetical protein JXR49_07095 [Acidobacteria bacterium]|nr:hypothetical protein [Acidobacteriota bacterium]
MRSFFTFAAMGIIIIAISSCGDKEESTASLQCDRRCLEGIVDQYLEAMVAHDPAAAPFAENIRFTENAKDINPQESPEGLWAEATALTDYKIYIADPQAGQIAFVGVVETMARETREEETVEVERPVILSMRLKIENERITESESIVTQSMMGGNTGEAMTVPPAAYSEALAPEERVSREELIKISNLYFDSIEQCNGKIVPWHEECYRLENGMWTAGQKLPDEMAVHMQEPPAPKPGFGDEDSPAFARGACTEAIDSGVFALIESIRPRRIPVVDEERGVTWGVYMFNHQGVETITMPDGSTQPAAYFVGQPNSMPMSELFKIKDGKIRDIMAIGVVNEYGSDSGWE